MRALLATMRAAVAEATANRRALAVQVAVMVLNDVAWIGFWVVFFRRTGTIRGWDVRRVILLQAVLTTAGGLVLGLLANARGIARLAIDGELDATLTLPVHPLAHLLVRRVEPTNFGDSVFGVTLFAVAGHPTPMRTLVFAACVATSVVLVTSFLVLAGSLAFWAGRPDGGELGFHGMMILSNWPVDIFGGTVRLLLSTVVPAVFVAGVPARLIQHFDPAQAAGYLTVTAVFAVAAVAVFARALRSYTSGSAWTRA